MAEYHHTSEFCLAKVKYPIYRQLTVLETVCETAVKVRGIGINYQPVNLEPCLVLRGKWLRVAGFQVGQKVQLVVNPGEVFITPKHITSEQVIAKQTDLTPSGERDEAGQAKG
ncbi:SymE family type I addiction module toxin [Thalassomonas actiniarum]|uniref:Type I addiction module toxin, SymE family n=1 Tax=Thalassomonas actiniarum TaxID=485447 RepID=A0AAE9YTF2_9GAMM|nr:SymE family type I addiction module toxin [Thalassomonas actiniarum]WDE00124.1 type I addiction module toxin, SymE family [Thalassomonas actiniarum]